MILAEITIVTTPAAVEVIAESLIAMGARGTAVQNPADILAVVEQPNVPYEYDDDLVGNLNEATLTAWFDEDHLGADHKQALEAKIKCELERIGTYIPIGSGEVSIQKVIQEDWENAWKTYYQPIIVSDQLVISPTWIDYNPQPGQHIIKLDPGGAFGTGSHASTLLTLELMEIYMIGDSKVLDVGCGSGILSIAAAKWGAYKIDALDIDPVAVETTIENAEINCCSDLINVQEGELYSLSAKQKYDFILMNIVADVIIDLLPIAADHLRPMGLLFCSGILNKKEDKVLTVARRSGFEVHERLERDEWVAFAFSHGS